MTSMKGYITSGTEVQACAMNVLDHIPELFWDRSMESNSSYPVLLPDVSSGLQNYILTRLDLDDMPNSSQHAL